MRPREIFIVGSGVSSCLNMPSWPAVFRSLAKIHLLPHQAEEIEATLNAPGKEYDAATRLSTYFGGDEVLEQMVEALIREAQSKITPASSSRLSPMSASAAVVAIITTNWDTLLSEKVTGFEVLCWPENPAGECEHIKTVARYLREGTRFVWHLHGALDRSRLIVTEKQRSVRENRILRHREAIGAWLSESNVVIFGSSLSDAVLQKILRDVAKYDPNISYLTRQSDRPSAGLRLLGPRNVQYFAELSAFPEALADFVLQRDPELPFFGFAPKNGDELLRYIQSSRATEDLILHIRTHCVDLAQLTNIAGEAAVEAYQGELIESGSILAMLLTNAAHEWQPRQAVLRELDKIVKQQLQTGELTKAHYVQPLAFAVGQKGQLKGCESIVI